MHEIFLNNELRLPPDISEQSAVDSWKEGWVEGTSCEFEAETRQQFLELMHRSDNFWELSRAEMC